MGNVLDVVMGLTIRILECAKIICSTAPVTCLRNGIKRIYNQRLFSEVIFCRGSENRSLEWEATWV